jgi:hypothetical protein
MKALKRRWKLIAVAVAILAALFCAAFIALAGYTQTQTVKAVSVAQSLTFRDPAFVPHITSISGVTLRVRGHIDGTATVQAENWTPQQISGDVDWSVYHDYFSSSIVIDYSPTNVTAGSLNFSLTFN